jgi:hypothetical protein
MMTIDIHIERLVLDGVSLTPADRARLRASVQAQLAERLSAQGIDLDTLQACDRAASLRAPGVQVAADPTPATWGSSIADAVYGALARPGVGGERQVPSSPASLSQASLGQASSSRASSGTASDRGGAR